MNETYYYLKTILECSDDIISDIKKIDKMYNNKVYKSDILEAKIRKAVSKYNETESIENKISLLKIIKFLQKEFKMLDKKKDAILAAIHEFIFKDIDANTHLNIMNSFWKDDIDPPFIDVYNSLQEYKKL